MAKKTAKEPLRHVLVPKHEKLSEKEKKAFLERYHAGVQEMPKILITDPAIRHLDPEVGDVIVIKRKSLTAGETRFYRWVVDE